MNLNGVIYGLPRQLKILIGAFVIVLSLGFTTGLLFVGETSSMNPEGIEEHYLGNEDKPDISVMKFRKNEREMLTLVHDHILSLSIVFFLVGLLLSLTDLHSGLKLFLMIEPLVSVLLTFGGLYLMWLGVSWMKYIVFISGTLMAVSFYTAVSIVFFQLFKKAA